MAFFAPTQLELAARRLALGRKRRLPRPFAPQYPKLLEKAYRAEWGQFVEAFARTIRGRILSRLPALLASQSFFRPAALVQDAPSDDFESLMEEVEFVLEQEWNETAVRNLARRKGVEVATFGAQLLRRNVQRVIGIDPILADVGLANELAGFVSENVALSISLREEAIGKIEKMVYTGFREGTRAEDLATQIERYIDPEVGNVRARADLIARDQVSKLTGQLNKIRQTELGIERYVWRTVGDERVRPSHEEKEGKIFSWDNPPPDTGHPTEDFQCRCAAIPLLSDLVPGAEEDE